MQEHCVRQRQHYAELKVYALETPGVCNASCEFDLQTLRPTYRLLLGLPGKSNAFAISEKLGLPQRIVARAAERLSSENKRFEDVLEQLDRSRTEMEAHEREAAESKRAFEAYRRETEQELERLRAEAEKELENAREKAYRMVESAKRSSDFIMEQMEALQKKKDSRRLVGGYGACAPCSSGKAEGDGAGGESGTDPPGRDVRSTAVAQSRRRSPLGQFESDRRGAGSTRTRTEASRFRPVR